MSNIFTTCIYFKSLLNKIQECKECMLLTKKLNKEEGNETNGKLCWFDARDLEKFNNEHKCIKCHITKDSYTFDDLRGSLKEYTDTWYYEHDKLEASMNHILNIIDFLEKRGDKKEEKDKK